MSDTTAPLAIVAGTGLLPRLIAEGARAEGRPYHVVVLEGVPVTWSAGHPVLAARFERIGTLFADLHAAGIKAVTFAGAMTRPTLDPAKADAGFLALAPQLMPALQAGDDAILRVILGAFEAEGFEIAAAHDLVPDLTQPAGCLTVREPDANDRADIARAAAIVKGLGALDIGQGAVVAQGLCMAVETIQGTDAMLAHAQAGLSRCRPDPNGARGVLWKAPKPAQDRRIDLPAIGPDTVRAAAAAGLAGIGIAAGGVMVLDRAATIDAADAADLFILAEPAP